MNVIDLTRELIAIPSINPNSLPEGQTSPGEAGMAARVEAALREIGASTETWDVYPGRPSVVGRLDFGAPETLIFDAHLDTVPVEGMTVDPFGGELRDGKIYGRGACDVKGPGAAVLCALAQVAAAAKAGPQPRYNVIYAGVCDEESGFRGVQSFVERLLAAPAQKIAGVVVVEPTLLNPIIAHKGTTRWNITTHGVAAHSSTPHLGENAIYKMAPLLDCLSDYATELQQRPPNPQLGAPTLSVGVIQGGSAVNVVPDACTIQVDRRLIPGETPASATAELQARLDKALGAGAVEISRSIVEAPPMATSAESDFVRQVLAAGKSAHSDATIQVASYCTDASFYPASLAPAVVFGPGSIEQAHTKDEWISVEQLEAGVAAFTKLIMG